MKQGVHPVGFPAGLLGVFLGVALGATAATAQTTASGEQRRPTFGGPDNVERQLEEDGRDEDSFLDQVFFGPYFGFKERVLDTGHEGR